VRSDTRLNETDVLEHLGGQLPVETRLRNRLALVAAKPNTYPFIETLEELGDVAVDEVVAPAFDDGVVRGHDRLQAYSSLTSREIADLGLEAAYRPRSGSKKPSHRR
jgi:hypothetical protein